MGSESAMRLSTSEFEVGGDVNQLGELAFKVLTLIVEKRFPEAIKALLDYRQTKLWYPQYDEKTTKFYSHAKDLVHAIEQKKNFPNFQSLAQSKQAEINQKALENMEDLRRTLRRIRLAEKDLTDGDSKSSVLVIYALLFSFTTIITVYVAKEMAHSFGTSFPTLLDQVAKDIMRSLSKFIGGI